MHGQQNVKLKKGMTKVTVPLRNSAKADKNVVMLRKDNNYTRTGK